ncbi:MAG: PEPxxWA-CTERM sorting domain-containing protein [Sphingomonadaceae bacterium]|nr:PEPxxWA-CTERM sorting domain-containing protein [Sphingomonadaceae bacterium]
MAAPFGRAGISSAEVDARLGARVRSGTLTIRPMAAAGSVRPTWQLLTVFRAGLGGVLSAKNQFRLGTNRSLPEQPCSDKPTPTGESVMRNVGLAIAAAALSIVPAQAAVNIVTNGSLETSPDYVAVTGGSAAIPGWTVAGDGVEWFQSESYLVPNFGPAHSGVSIVDLAFDENGAPSVFGGISQALTTAVGQTYQLSFYGVNTNAFGRDGTGIVTALAGASPIILTNGGQSSNPNAGWSADDWQLFTGTFTATSTSTLLTLGNNQDANLHFALIDDVSVNAVPEPGIWAMMIAGFGLLGGALRRRRRRTTALYA